MQSHMCHSPARDTKNIITGDSIITGEPGGATDSPRAGAAALWLMCFSTAGFSDLLETKSQAGPSFTCGRETQVIYITRSSWKSLPKRCAAWGGKPQVALGREQALSSLPFLFVRAGHGGWGVPPPPQRGEHLRVLLHKWWICGGSSPFSHKLDLHFPLRSWEHFCKPGDSSQPGDNEPLSRDPSVMRVGRNLFFF